LKPTPENGSIGIGILLPHESRVRVGLYKCWIGLVFPFLYFLGIDNEDFILLNGIFVFDTIWVYIQYHARIFIPK
jgi:hypothetical protein